MAARTVDELLDKHFDPRHARDRRRPLHDDEPLQKVVVHVRYSRVEDAAVRDRTQPPRPVEAFAGFWPLVAIDTLRDRVAQPVEHTARHRLCRDRM